MKVSTTIKRSMNAFSVIAFMLLLLAVIFLSRSNFTKKHSGNIGQDQYAKVESKSSPEGHNSLAEANSAEEENIAKFRSSLEQASRNPKALGDILVALFAENEQLALKVIAGMDISDYDQVVYIEAVANHFSRYPLLDAIDKFGILKDTQPDLHYYSIRMSFSDFVTPSPADQIVNFFNEDVNENVFIDNANTAATHIGAHYGLEGIKEIENIKDEQFQKNMLTSAYAGWFHREPFEALTHINQFKSLPPILNETVSSLVYRMATDQPAKVMEWAESVSSEGLREELVSFTAVNWKRNEPDSYEDWINATGTDPKLVEISQNAVSSSLGNQ